MLRKYKKIIQHHLPRSRIVVFVSIIVALFLSINLTKEIINRRQIDEKIQNYQKEVTRLERENNEITNLISSWKTGGQLEKEARLKLGLKKPGENTVLVVRNNNNLNGSGIIDPNSEILGGRVVPSNKNDLPNYKKWWIYFLGIK